MDSYQPRLRWVRLYPELARITYARAYVVDPWSEQAVCHGDQFGVHWRRWTETHLLGTDDAGAVFVDWDMALDRADYQAFEDAVLSAPGEVWGAPYMLWTWPTGPRWSSCNWSTTDSQLLEGVESWKDRGIDLGPLEGVARAAALSVQSRAPRVVPAEYGDERSDIVGTGVVWAPSEILRRAWADGVDVRMKYPAEDTELCLWLQRAGLPRPRNCWGCQPKHLHF